VVHSRMLAADLLRELAAQTHSRLDLRRQFKSLAEQVMTVQRPESVAVEMDVLE
jgi:hypothetical protein